MTRYPPTTPPTSEGFTLATLPRFRLNERCLLLPELSGDKAMKMLSRGFWLPRHVFMEPEKVCPTFQVP